MPYKFFADLDDYGVEYAEPVIGWAEKIPDGWHIEYMETTSGVQIKFEELTPDDQKRVLKALNEIEIDPGLIWEF